jgi:hypothetical protein
MVNETTPNAGPGTITDALITPVPSWLAEAQEDGLGNWLARNWGVLADTPPELLALIDL